MAFYVVWDLCVALTTFWPDLLDVTVVDKLKLADIHCEDEFSLYDG